MKSHLFMMLAAVVTCSFVLCSTAEAKPKEGDACNNKAFTNTCDGNNLLLCDNKGKVKAIHCSKNTDKPNSVCAEFSAPNIARCVSDEDKCNNEGENITKVSETAKGKQIFKKLTCEKASNGHLYSLPQGVDRTLKEACAFENETISRCETSQTGKTNIVSYRCEKTSSGLYYRITDQKKCYGGFGTCSPDGECLPPESCDADFENHCDGNIATNCTNKQLQKTDCDQKGGKTPFVCTMNKDKAICIAANKECSEEGEENIFSCNPKTNKAMLQKCTRMSDGKLYYKHTLESIACLNGCNADKTDCAPAPCEKAGATRDECARSTVKEALSETRDNVYLMHTGSVVNHYICKKTSNNKLEWSLDSVIPCDNGAGTCNAGKCTPAETCSKSTFTPHCDGNTRVTCINGKVHKNECSTGRIQQSCAVIDGKPKCMSDKKSCTNEGEVVTSHCFKGKEFYNECIKGSNGKLYYNRAGSKKCQNGCNADGTACQ